MIIVIEIFFNFVFIENVVFNKIVFYISVLNEFKYDFRNVVDLSWDGGECMVIIYSK